MLVTGDIADNAAAEEYAIARELLERIGVPVYPLAGNHDDGAALRSAFDLPGEANGLVQYAVDLGPLRLVVADTTLPGEDRGELDAARLAVARRDAGARLTGPRSWRSTIRRSCSAAPCGTRSG